MQEPTNECVNKWNDKSLFLSLKPTHRFFKVLLNSISNSIPAANPPHTPLSGDSHSMSGPYHFLSTLHQNEFVLHLETAQPMVLREGAPLMPNAPGLGVSVAQVHLLASEDRGTHEVRHSSSHTAWLLMVMFADRGISPRQTGPNHLILTSPEEVTGSPFGTGFTELATDFHAHPQQPKAWSREEGQMNG